MILRRAFLCIVCSVAVFFIACTPAKTAYSSRENLYKKSTQDLGTKLLAFHVNDSLTNLFFTFGNENFLYKRPDTSAWFYALVKVRYVLHDAKTQQIVDSGSTVLSDRQTENVSSRQMSGSLPIKCYTQKEYVCDVTIYDSNKKLRFPYVILIDKTSAATRQNFLLLSKEGKILFDYNLHPRDTVLIQSFTNKENNFVADHFRRDFPLPPNPYTPVERTTFNYKPDSSFTISRSSGRFTVVVPEKGFYHIITKKETKDGLTIYSTHPSFPGIKDETEMIKCIRYITLNSEYNQLLASDDKKKAIDEFWKEKGGSNERAKELLKKYYGRVMQANKLFTSFQLGWQTDRGMIYVVFGPPNAMHKYSNSETWVYGDENLPTSIRFNFMKVINPFTDNDFVLERNEQYKLPWHQAVTGWKEGHIYFDN
jgi:GWxTD domain-containing protein